MDTNRRSRLAASTLEVLLAAAIILVAVLGVVRPAIGPAGLGVGTGPLFGASPTVDVTLDADAVTITTTPQLPSLGGDTVEPGDGIEFLIPTRTSVAVQVPDLRQRMAFAAIPILGGLLTIGVLTLLLLITRTLRQGDPFVAANARRLYLIAALVGIGGQAAVILANWGRLGILHHPDVAPYTHLDVQTTFVPLFAGFAIAVAAEVFRQGARLRAEVEGLV